MKKNTIQILLGITVIIVLLSLLPEEHIVEYLEDEQFHREFYDNSKEAQERITELKNEGCKIF